ANSVLVFAGFLLLLMQLHGYQHTSHPHEFSTNKDDLAHVHKDTVAPIAPDPPAHEGHEKKIDPSPKGHSHGHGKPHSH
ncbi:MAG: HupE/UreJ family protein, partial [Oleiphilaceae bacterium]|nr:HupE/UreJ family protein [Oleiphilaceae bacterium]